jgi:NhaA family Na+:H+ antiporter
VIFFLLVGLEIRRELHQGELSDVKRATLPIAAAIGGMLAPALIFIGLNTEAGLRQGWGIPTATDIAFAVGVLALLGDRVPAALRVLLLALAIIDDIGAIVIIALFYSAGIELSGLLVGAAGLATIVLFQRLGVRRALVYVLPGSVLWYGMLMANVHPAIAGVIVGLMTPCKPWFGREGFLTAAARAIDDFREHVARDGHTSHDLLLPLRQIKLAQREALPPVIRVETALHPWVAYAIMPLFALANAGVTVSGLDLADAGSTSVMLGVGLGLVLGKPAGVLLTSYLTVKLGLASLPRGVTWSGVLLVGAVAGIGFTMAIFIAALAFPNGAMLPAAKLGVLGGSLVAAVAGLLWGRAVLPSRTAPGAAASVAEAEASTES